MEQNFIAREQQLKDQLEERLEKSVWAGSNPSGKKSERRALGTFPTLSKSKAWTGVDIKEDNARITFGSKADASIARIDSKTLLVDADKVHVKNLMLNGDDLAQWK